MARIMAFWDPWADPYNSGFQLTQSLIAIGSGEWFGVGLGGSVQKLFYLPEAHTDFVFAVIAEEFGLVGSVVVIVLFGVLVWRAFGIARESALAGGCSRRISRSVSRSGRRHRSSSTSASTWASCRRRA